MAAKSLLEARVGVLRNSRVNVDKRFALNVEENFMEDLVLAKNKLTNNLKNGSEEKIYNCVQCVKLTLRKVKVAIT
jgi:hypothetical protein